MHWQVLMLHIQDAARSIVDRHTRASHWLALSAVRNRNADRTVDRLRCEFLVFQLNERPFWRYDALLWDFAPWKYLGAAAGKRLCTAEFKREQVGRLAWHETTGAEPSRLHSISES